MTARPNPWHVACASRSRSLEAPGVAYLILSPAGTALAAPCPTHTAPVSARQRPKLASLVRRSSTRISRYARDVVDVHEGFRWTAESGWSACQFPRARRGRTRLAFWWRPQSSGPTFLKGNLDLMRLASQSLCKLADGAREWLLSGASLEFANGGPGDT